MMKTNLDESEALVVSPNVEKSGRKPKHYIQIDNMVDRYGLRSSVYEIEF